MARRDGQIPRGIYDTSGRVISGERRCNTRSGLVRGMVLQIATAFPEPASFPEPGSTVSWGRP